MMGPARLRITVQPQVLMRDDPDLGRDTLNFVNLRKFASNSETTNSINQMLEEAEKERKQ